MCFIGSKGALISSFKTTERFHLGRFLELLGLPYEGGEQPVELRALTDMEGVKMIRLL